ncbi:Glucosamine-6-phosphate deaminase [Mycoplasma yeatsii 13926]|uniref:Glucosamine-6-phosphate deaminase n=1 Tax=Mycoplasma yeatsii 13926 TaxID=1188240 RepID=S6G8L5_9MOLU|nr:glucosamine-6-phosphate deaminase [Mycoplasma yeatsii]EOA07529.1 Glucosamine-6-phosphate deaminase [Mycoplasma yeatsii 13926]
MKVIILNNYEQIANKTSEIIANQIKQKPNSILGLATGSSPVKTYQKLIDMYKNKEISFKDITVFNLDEYKNIDSNNNQSYSYFMKQQLFNHVDINLDNCFIPNFEFNNDPKKYDELIKSKGQIDLQLLGLGVNGHIAFNEPYTSFDSLTHIVDLTQSTIQANSRFFDDINLVPKQAITMGLESIMSAKKIVLIATGINKAEAIKNLIEGNISEKWPCSILQNHKDVTIIIDKDASIKLENSYES